MKRETRFTMEVLGEAVRRLNVTKDAALEEVGQGPQSGQEVFDALGWAALAVNELAQAEVDVVHGLGVGNHDTGLMVSFWDGLLLGAIAADIVWEKSFGIEVETPTC